MDEFFCFGDFLAWTLLRKRVDAEACLGWVDRCGWEYIALSVR